MNNGKYSFVIEPVTVKKLREILDMLYCMVDDADDIPVTIITEFSQKTATYVNYVEKTKDDGTTITRKFTIE